MTQNERFDRFGEQQCWLIDADAPYKATLFLDPGIIADELGVMFEDVAKFAFSGEWMQPGWYVVPATVGVVPVVVPELRRAFTSFFAARKTTRKCEIIKVGNYAGEVVSLAERTRQTIFAFDRPFTVRDVMRRMGRKNPDGAMRQEMANMVKRREIVEVGRATGKGRGQRQRVYAVAKTAAA